MVPGGFGTERPAAPTRLRRGRVASVGLLAGLALLVAACGQGDDTAAKSSTKTALSSSSTTTTTTTTTVPATTAPPVTVGIVCSTPDEAAKALVDAWKAGDQAAAARCADQTVVAKIFETDGAGAQWSFEGCGGDDPGVPQCFYRYEGGGVTLTLNGTEATGWKVTSIGFVAD